MQEDEANSSTIQGERHSLIDQAHARFTTVVVIFSFVFLAISLRLIDLTILGVDKADYHQKKTIDKKVNARSDITDRNGVLLASSLKTASLFADPKMIDDPVKVADDLIKILPEEPYGKILQKLQSNKRFVWLKRKISPNQHYAINALGHPGLDFREEYSRIYPQNNLMSHIIGYTDMDGKGIAGIESGFNNLLSENSKDLKLTIDTRIQHILHKSLADKMKEFKALAASGIIMNAKNGEIIAMVSLPDFNPHHIGDPKDIKYFNNNLSGLFEMGSTFKALTIANAIETKSIRKDQLFDATKPLKSGRFSINDYHAKKKIMTVPETFIYSSNIGTALISEETGKEKILEFYKKIGFTDYINTELPEKAKPRLPNPWRNVDTLTTSYGHGISVTPLHLVRAMAAMVNGGYLLDPSFVKSEHDAISSIITNTENQVISEDTSEYIRQIMELNVVDERGSGGKAKVEGYRIGGKTGSANKVINGKYSDKKLLSSFIGAFPINDPQYIILAILDEPIGHKKSWGYATGGWTGAPVVGKTIEKMAPILNIAPILNNKLNNILHKGKKHDASFRAN